MRLHKRNGSAIALLAVAVACAFSLDTCSTAKSPGYAQTNMIRERTHTAATNTLRSRRLRHTTNLRRKKRKGGSTSGGGSGSGGGGGSAGGKNNNNNGSGTSRHTGSTNTANNMAQGNANTAAPHGTESSSNASTTHGSGDTYGYGSFPPSSLPPLPRGGSPTPSSSSSSSLSSTPSPTPIVYSPASSEPTPSPGLSKEERDDEGYGPPTGYTDKKENGMRKSTAAVLEKQKAMLGTRADNPSPSPSDDGGGGVGTEKEEEGSASSNRGVGSGRSPGTGDDVDYGHDEALKIGSEGSSLSRTSFGKPRSLNQRTRTAMLWARSAEAEVKRTNAKYRQMLNEDTSGSSRDELRQLYDVAQAKSFFSDRVAFMTKQAAYLLNHSTSASSAGGTLITPEENAEIERDLAAAAEAEADLSLDDRDLLSTYNDLRRENSALESMGSAGAVGRNRSSSSSSSSYRDNGNRGDGDGTEHSSSSTASSASSSSSSSAPAEKQRIARVPETEQELVQERAKIQAEYAKEHQNDNSNCIKGNMPYLLDGKKQGNSCCSGTTQALTTKQAEYYAPNARSKLDPYKWQVCSPIETKVPTTASTTKKSATSSSSSSYPFEPATAK